MKKCVRKWFNVFLCGIILLGGLLGCGNVANATGTSTTVVGDLPYIVLDKYTLTNEKIIPGQEFTLTLYLKNRSKTQTAYDVVVDIDNPGGVLPIYGTVSQAIIAEIEPGEITEVSFTYSSLEELITDYLDFSIALSGTVANWVTLRAPVGTDSPFNILGVAIPSEMYTGEVASTSVSFRVLGDENVRDVYLELLMDGEVVGKSSLGILTPGVTRTQSISPIVNVPGTYETQLVMYYSDEMEQEKSVIAGSAVVAVVQRDVLNHEDTMGDTQEQEQDSMNKSIIMGVGGIIILCAISVVILGIRKRR